MAAKPRPKAAPTAAAAGAVPIACAGGGRTWLVPFESAPFPYRGDIPGGGPFLDKRDGERRGHTSPRGGLYWEDPTYSDSRVLLSVPPRVRPEGATIVLFLHGNLATLEGEVCTRQAIPRQVAASGLNAVLVAPQFAVNALDSSAGKLWSRGGMSDLLAEAARVLAGLGFPGLDAAPVVIAAYSGGYLPAVFGLQVGGVADRVRGLALFDALFGEVDRYAEVVAQNRARMFFVSAYSASSREPNAALRRLLAARGIEAGENLPPHLRPGTVAFVPATAASHGEFMNRSFARDPLAALLRAVG